jgi:hypothetical protein
MLRWVSSHYLSIFPAIIDAVTRFCSIMKVQKMDLCINSWEDASRHLVGLAFLFSFRRY